MMSRTDSKSSALPRLVTSCVLILGLLGPGGAFGAEKRTMKAAEPTKAIRTAPATSLKAKPTVPARIKKATRKEALSPKPASRPGKLVAPKPAGIPVGPGGTSSAAGSLSGVGQPNLVIEAIVALSTPEGFPNSGFCGPSGPGGGASSKVRLFIRNTGTSPAGVNTAAVHWGNNSGMATLPVPNLMPGQSHIVEANIPQGCWGNTIHGSCDFLIEADRNDDVNESDDSGDNYENGSCMSPGT